jgi:hypothetical protein
VVATGVLRRSKIQSVFVLVFDNEHLLVFFGMPDVLVPLIQRDLMRHVINRAVKEQAVFLIDLLDRLLLPYSQHWLLNTGNHDLLEGLVGIVLDFMDLIDLELVLLGLRTENRTAFTIDTVNYSSILIDFSLSRHQKHVHPFVWAFAY